MAGRLIDHDGYDARPRRSGVFRCGVAGAAPAESVAGGLAAFLDLSQQDADLGPQLPHLELQLAPAS